MVSPVATAYNDIERARSPYLQHAAPNVSFPGLALSAHPDFNRYWPLWRTIRDCYEGESTVKAAGQTYLPKLTAHKEKEYEAFLRRTYFYNATRRTHEGLMGSLFRKPPEFTLPPAAQGIPLDDVTIDSQNIFEFSKTVGSEVTLMGRYGILVDLPAADNPDLVTAETDQPYMSGYCAECVYGWREVMHRGRRVVDRVILREEETNLSEYGVSISSIVRVLRLDPDPEDPASLIYSQEIIRGHPDKDQPPSITSVPVTVRGRKLNYIPFVFVNVKNLLPGCGAPPLIDIATINISHYQSTALLEWGRFYAGMPTYVVSAGTEGSGDAVTADTLAVGPSNVWELEQGAKAWILEFTGHGLTFLENAVDSKQLQMQSLGGKLISAQQKSAALSSEAYSLMEAGDEATLLDVAEQVERGLAKALTYLADFRGVDLTNSYKLDADGNPLLDGTGRRIPDRILVEMNKEFVPSELTAREIRAIQQLYMSGLIPLDVLYYALRSVQVIPVEYTLEDFKALMTQNGQLYPDATGQQKAALDRDNKVEVARITAHVDQPALATQTVPDPTKDPDPDAPDNSTTNPRGGAPGAPATSGQTSSTPKPGPAPKRTPGTLKPRFGGSRS